MSFFRNPCRVMELHIPKNASRGCLFILYIDVLSEKYCFYLV